MTISPAQRRLIQSVACAVVMYVTLQLAIYWGVEEKSWWQKSWEFVTGGTLGAIAGVVVFFTIGAIGWVAGPIYGALGLFGLMVGGALGGMGFGALVHIIRDPSDFNFNVPVLALTILIGFSSALGLNRYIGSRLRPLEGLDKA